MTRYAEPTRCPDCGSPISLGAPACPSCQLSLRGPVAQELYATLLRADDLLVSLRAEPRSTSQSAPATSVPTGPGPTAPSVTAVPGQLGGTGVDGASVPKILLTLGAGCLLVAALVFLAVSWSVLGVGGRTAVLLGFTVAAGGLTGLVARRALRGAVESLGLVTLGLFALDVVGARNAGWLGDPSLHSFNVLLGGVLAGVAATACVLLRRTPSGAFTAGEVVAALGVGTAAVGLASGSWGVQEGRLLITVLLTLAAVAVFDQVRLVVAAIGSTLVSAIAWLLLASAGVERVVDNPSVAGVWGDLDAWPALAAAAVAGALGAVPRLPLTARQASASVAAGMATFVVVGPVLDETATQIALTFVAVVAVAATVVWFAPKPWSAAALVTLFTGTLVTLGVTVVLGTAAVARLLEAAVEPGRFADLLPSQRETELAPWLLLLAVPALCLAIQAILRYADQTVVWMRLLPFIATATLLATAALYPLPVWVFVAAGLAAGAAFLWYGELGYGAVGLAGGTLVALHSTGLVSIALPVVVVAAVWLLLTDERDTVRATAGVIGQLALGASVWAWGDLLDRPGSWVAAVGIVVVAAAPLATRRPGVELGAAFGAAALFVAGTFSAPDSEVSSWVAVYLTLAGSATSAQALLRDDRRRLGWVGGLLFAMATWVRLADLGVDEPEPYTLPSAVALIVLGLLHLHRLPGSSTVRALGPGLGLALLPSLLWVLAEPASLRSVLLGLACLALVVAGVQLRWTAPLVYAGTVGAVVVLRHAAPYAADSNVPRWVLIGFAGALLVGMGVTWEERVRQARTALGYVRALR